MYPDPLKAISRRLNANTVLTSTPFKRFGKINFGARMAIFNYNEKVVVWSAIPYGDEVKKAFELLTGSASPNVSYLVIPDKEHTMAAKSFKDNHPELKIIAMETVDLGEKYPIDYTITSKYSHKVIGQETLREIGITDPEIVDNFEFVYLPHHANKELVMYDKNHKTVYEADLLFNLGGKKPLEQFSPQLGYPENYFPHLGWSFLTRYMDPYSSVGQTLQRRIANTSLSAPGLKAIYSWDFDQIVMCHGQVIESEGKAAFKALFGNVL